MYCSYISLLSSVSQVRALHRWLHLHLCLYQGNHGIPFYRSNLPVYTHLQLGEMKQLPVSFLLKETSASVVGPYSPYPVIRNRKWDHAANKYSALSLIIDIAELSNRQHFGILSASILQLFGMFCNVTATVPHDRETFGTNSGTIGMLSRRIRLLRIGFGVYTATFRVPFREYMPNAPDGEAPPILTAKGSRN